MVTRGRVLHAESHEDHAGEDDEEETEIELGKAAQPGPAFGKSGASLSAVQERIPTTPRFGRTASI